MSCIDALAERYQRAVKSFSESRTFRGGPGWRAVIGGLMIAVTASSLLAAQAVQPPGGGGQPAAQAAAQQTLSAQTPAQQSATQPSAPAPTRTAESSEETFRPRLPMYYGKVVTEEQRQKIYDIQRKYFPQIRALQKQLEALIAKRDAEIEAVLTPQQKAEIERLRKEAAARRASGAAATQEQRASSTEK
jgi:Spy/CpxP family protein refolding chaperone